MERCYPFTIFLFLFSFAQTAIFPCVARERMLGLEDFESGRIRLHRERGAISCALQVNGPTICYRTVGIHKKRTYTDTRTKGKTIDSDGRAKSSSADRERGEEREKKKTQLHDFWGVYRRAVASFFFRLSCCVLTFVSPFWFRPSNAR